MGSIITSAVTALHSPHVFIILSLVDGKARSTASEAGGGPGATAALGLAGNLNVRLYVVCIRYHL